MLASPTHTNYLGPDNLHVSYYKIFNLIPPGAEPSFFMNLIEMYNGEVKPKYGYFYFRILFETTSVADRDDTRPGLEVCLKLLAPPDLYVL